MRPEFTYDQAIADRYTAIRAGVLYATGLANQRPSIRSIAVNEPGNGRLVCELGPFSS
jgi:hypothetical protein